MGNFKIPGFSSPSYSCRKWSQQLLSVFIAWNFSSWYAESVCHMQLLVILHLVSVQTLDWSFEQSFAEMSKESCIFSLLHLHPWNLTSNSFHPSNVLVFCSSSYSIFFLSIQPATSTVVLRLRLWALEISQHLLLAFHTKCGFISVCKEPPLELLAIKQLKGNHPGISARMVRRSFVDMVLVNQAYTLKWCKVYTFEN